MANMKFSQIAGGTPVAAAGATDVFVGVRSGTTDVLLTGVYLDTAQTWTAKQTYGVGFFSLLGSSTGFTLLNSANASTTNYTQTLQAKTGTIALTAPAPILVGASLSVTAAMSGSCLLLNTAAGSVATLPAASGSGNTFIFVVSTATTSNAHKILAASTSDYIIGNAMGEHSGTVAGFQSPATTNHSIQMPFAGTQPSGGLVGDQFTLTDIAANLYQCTGSFTAGTTPTTPFSTADS